MTPISPSDPNELGFVETPPSAAQRLPTRAERTRAASAGTPPLPPSYGGGASNDEKHFLLHLLTSQARGGGVLLTTGRSFTLHFNPFMQLLFAGEVPLFVLRNLSRRELSTCAWRRRC